MSLLKKSMVCSSLVIVPVERDTVAIGLFLAVMTATCLLLFAVVARCRPQMAPIDLDR